MDFATVLYLPLLWVDTYLLFYIAVQLLTEKPKWIDKNALVFTTVLTSIVYIEKLFFMEQIKVFGLINVILYFILTIVLLRETIRTKLIVFIILFVAQLLCEMLGSTLYQLISGVQTPINALDFQTLIGVGWYTIGAKIVIVWLIRIWRNGFARRRG